MGKFEVQEGYLHLLFGNDDSYCLDSLIRLNLTDYLYHELKKKNFDYVWFISGIQDPYSVKACDEGSFKTFHEVTRSMLGKLFGSETPEYTKESFKGNLDQIIKLMKNTRKSAFVFRIDTFSSVFAYEAQTLAELALAAAHSKNIVVICASITASGSLPRFRDENSIFRAKWAGSYLFPEIQTVFSGKNPAEESCYQSLKKLMKDRCVFLNSFGEKEISRLVRWILFMKLNRQEQPGEENVEQTARFIRDWYASGSVREQYRDIFSPNHRHLYSELQKDIQRRWASLTEMASSYRAGLYAGKRYEEAGVIADDELALRMESVHFPADSKAVTPSMYMEWSDLLAEYLKPRAAAMDKGLEQFLIRCVDRLDEVIDGGDLVTFERICTTLRYGTGISSAEDINEDILSWYDKIISMSMEVFSLNRKLRSGQEQIDRWKEEMDQKKEYISQLSGNVDTTVLAHEKQQALILMRKIESARKIYFANSSTIATYQDMLGQWEMMVSQSRNQKIDLAEVRKMVARCADEMMLYHERSEQEQDEISRNLFKLEDALNSPYSGLTVDQEYEKALNRLRESQQMPVPGKENTEQKEVSGKPKPSSLPEDIGNILLF